ncbi:MAG: hypothetical protein WCV50_01020 [Patescibacteria group bacterium]|jgi:hypothetical protein
MLRKSFINVFLLLAFILILFCTGNKHVNAAEDNVIINESGGVINLDELKQKNFFRDAKQSWDKLRFANIVFFQQGDKNELVNTEDTFTFFDEEEVVVSGVSDPDSWIKIIIADNDKNYNTTANNEGFWTFKITEKVSLGDHNLSVETYNKDNNLIARSEKIDFTIISNVYKKTIVSLGKSEETASASSSTLVRVVLMIFISVAFFVIVAALILLNHRRSNQIAFKR